MKLVNKILIFSFSVAIILCLFISISIIKHREKEKKYEKEVAVKMKNEITNQMKEKYNFTVHMEDYDYYKTIAVFRPLSNLEGMFARRKGTELQIQISLSEGDWYVLGSMDWILQGIIEMEYEKYLYENVFSGKIGITNLGKMKEIIEKYNKNTPIRDYTPDYTVKLMTIYVIDDTYPYCKKPEEVNNEKDEECLEERITKFVNGKDIRNIDWSDFRKKIGFKTRIVIAFAEGIDIKEMKKELDKYYDNEIITIEFHKVHSDGNDSWEFNY